MPRFELNIARQMGLEGTELYFHFAKVILGATRENDAIAQAKTFMLAFPEPEWQLQLTRWDEVGKGIVI